MARSEPGEAIDREPTPLEAAVLAETVEQMMRGLEPDDRTIIELSLQGYTAAEIVATSRPRSARSLACERIKRRLERMKMEEVAGP